MALNRNHSQEGGVVIPNAERYLAGGWGPGAGGRGGACGSSSPQRGWDGAGGGWRWEVGGPARAGSARGLRY